jgi:hypothetical protein
MPRIKSNPRRWDLTDEELRASGFSPSEPFSTRHRHRPLTEPIILFLDSPSPPYPAASAIHPTTETAPAPPATAAAGAAAGAAAKRHVITISDDDDLYGVSDHERSRKRRRLDPAITRPRAAAANTTAPLRRLHGEAGFRRSYHPPPLSPSFDIPDPLRGVQVGPLNPRSSTPTVGNGNGGGNGNGRTGETGSLATAPWGISTTQEARATQDPSSDEEAAAVVGG